MPNSNMIETVVNHVKETYPELKLGVEYIGGCEVGGANDDRAWSIRCNNKSINAWIWYNRGSRSMAYWHEMTKFTLGATHCKDALFVNHLIQGNFAHWLKEMEYYLLAYQDERAALLREGKKLVLADHGRFMKGEV
jgi:hypothetical protein